MRYYETLMRSNVPDAYVIRPTRIFISSWWCDCGDLIVYIFQYLIVRSPFWT